MVAGLFYLVNAGLLFHGFVSVATLHLSTVASTKAPPCSGRPPPETTVAPLSTASRTRLLAASDAALTAGLHLPAGALLDLRQVVLTHGVLLDVSGS